MKQGSEKRQPMKKILLMCLAFMAVFAAGFRAGAVDTILVLSANTPEEQAIAAGFKSAFSGSLEEYNLEGSDEKQREIGKKLKGQNPPAAVVIGDLAAQMAVWHLADVPVVYCDSMMAAKLGLAKVAAGVYHEPDPAEQFEVLHQVFPDRTRVGLIYSPQNTNINLEDVNKRAVALGVSLEIGAMDSIKDVPVKIQQMMPTIEVLWVITDPVVLSQHSIQFIVMQSISAQVPIFCGNNDLAHSGGTAALVPDLNDAGIQAARLAEKAAKTRAQDGTVVFPEGKIVLNRKAASLLKVTFSSEIVGRASDVIE